MRTNVKARAAWLSAILVTFGLGIFNGGTVLAQTTSAKVESRNFEVLAVDGNRLVYRDQHGAHEITPPDDFRLTVDGRKLAVKELKPGMKGTAIVTTTTTITPVTATEVRDALVLSTTATSVMVRGADGVKRRFTQAEIDKRGIEILKDGRLIRVSQLNKGDQLTATIFSSQPPTIVTETEVEAKLAQGKAEPAPTTVAAAAPAPAPAAAAPAPTAVASSAPVAPSAPPMKAAPPEQSQSWWLWAAILIAVVIAYLFMRKKKS